MGYKNKLLIYMHIPKCGGTTLTEIIKRQYEKNIVCTNDINSVLDKIAKSDTFMGHFPYGVHHHFSKPSIYISMMREPIERIISLFYYIRSTKAHRFHHKVQSLTLDQFIAQKEFEEETLNLQTRYFCGGQLDLELAKKNLTNHFIVVGITELFDESINIMKRELAWKKIKYIKLNVNNKRPIKCDLSNSTIEKIKEITKLDIELYRYAKKLLEQKIKNNKFLD